MSTTFRRRATIALALALTVPSVAATAADTCASRGYLIDRDLKGTNMRAEPRADAPVIGHLPPLRNLTETDIVGVEFEMIDSRNGWLLIRNAEIDDPNTGEIRISGTGWVWGGLISVTPGDARLRAAPREDAPVLAWLRDQEQGWGADSFAIKAVHGCSGVFADVTVAPPSGGKTMRGWIGHFCSNQLTTCDYAYPEGVQIPPDARYPR